MYSNLMSEFVCFSCVALYRVTHFLLKGIEFYEENIGKLVFSCGMSLFAAFPMNAFAFNKDVMNSLCNI